MNNIRLNSISLEELTNIHLLCNDDFVPALSERVCIYEYCNKLYKNAEIISCHNNNNLVGTIGMYCNDLSGSVAYISTVCVHPTMRGKKIGDLLLSTAKVVAKDKGMKTIKLEVDRNNYKAISLYLKKGFKQCENLTDTFYMEIIL
jgi:ribosomal protein S18 acetylase RimI-like enzyme